VNVHNVIQCLIIFGAMVALTKPLGWYMAKVYEGDLPRPVRWLRPIENLTYRI
jgi:K+-transporting ATPase ATPase A chain